MSNILGNSIKMSTFGTSHSALMGVTLYNIAPGIKISTEFIKDKLSKRRPYKVISTSRVEDDNFEIVSGINNEYTDGNPLTILVHNTKQISSDYNKIKNYYRPSHADYTQTQKSQGFADLNGGGMSSGRLTTLFVIAGSICLEILNKKKIYIGSHIYKVQNFVDTSFFDLNIEEALFKLVDSKYPIFKNFDEVEKIIVDAKSKKDSVGGIIETAIINVEAGIGEPMFDSIESNLSKVLFSIPAIKGIEFGKGFDSVKMYGSQYNDQFTVIDNKLQTTSNNDGGINGGIANGMPIIFKTVVKPTSSIGTVQTTINKDTNQLDELVIEGRHDPAIFPRVPVIIDCLTAFVILDYYCTRYGYLWMK